jgi:glycosyltransferase involved in cell wall biosynthesis
LGEEPFVSVIIPAHNASPYLESCLTAVVASSYPSFEVIVVDDASTDNTAEIARKYGADVLRLNQKSGPAAARNYGEQKAKGDILFFIDSDILVQRGTIARVTTNFLENPDIAAVFGTYDDSPAEKNFISQYKNLFHHFIHQQSSSEAATFWAGCGAIRKEVFKRMGGFDRRRYLISSIEDIELGYRMKKEGYRILLDKDLQVKHLKKWKFISFLNADILYRAVPWSNLILESGKTVNDLNLKISYRLSAGLVGLLAGILPFSILEPRLFYGISILLVIIFALNYKLYYFFLKRRGIRFAVLSLPLHLLYYFYSGVTFLSCWFMHIYFRGKSPK